MSLLDTIPCPESMAEIIDDYDGFIVDQFGVLHDGYAPYPQAVPALQRLIDAGKTVVILSNSGKRAAVNIQRMAKLGFERVLYTDFVTSGDVAYATVQAQFIQKGLCRCMLIARDQDRSAVDGLELELTAEPRDAELVIIAGSEGDRYSEQHYKDLLQGAAERNVPALCTNPDKLMLTPYGLRYGAGRIAQMYQQMGGTVQWFGKPYPEVYEYAMLSFAEIDSQRILCIGDSLEHDIAGGLKVGLHTLFIRGGIHRDMNESQLVQYMEQHGAQPQYWMPSFQ